MLDPGTAASFGALAIGSVPQAYDRLKNKDAEISHQLITAAEANAEYVLHILTFYGQLIKKEEAAYLKQAYWDYRNEMQKFETLAAEPPAYWIEIMNTKLFRKFKREKRMREAAKKLLDHSLKARTLASRASDKFLFKQILAANKGRESESSRGDASSAQSETAHIISNNWYSGCRSSRVPDDETDSIISRKFRPYSSRTKSGSVADAQTSANAVDDSNAAGPSNLGVPLARLDTTDTTSSLSGTALVAK
ncbi:hypothetical protein C8R47DRAFT_1218453 [Mycena vitilis]|nr:hypothetical protein C8R47DRAFT_1074019 [Mycena vitilis]KAJ6481286.1 hypothetical protein C8R47DRAFT_1218453 [Mycena vitilis]